MAFKKVKEFWICIFRNAPLRNSNSTISFKVLIKICSSEVCGCSRYNLRGWTKAEVEGEKEVMRTCASEAGSNGERGGENTVLILITN
jgi:hypothetical protein